MQYTLATFNFVLRRDVVLAPSAPPGRLTAVAGYGPASSTARARLCGERVFLQLQVRIAVHMVLYMML